MIITKEHQEQMVANYQKNHSFDEMVGYVDGLNAMLELVERLSKEDVETKNVCPIAYNVLQLPEGRDLEQ